MFPSYRNQSTDWLHKLGYYFLRDRNIGLKGHCVRYILLACFVCLKESACERRKNVFYFNSKALYVLEIIHF